MKPDNPIPKIIAVIIILLGVELVANFVMSSEARTKYVDNVGTAEVQAKAH
ncbi:MAG TPA: hypothetical protein VK949_08180 [Methylotenera sp.]|nr:hypothetical protein [Methylotenera sp.]